METGIAIQEIIKETQQLMEEGQGSMQDMANFSRLATFPKDSPEKKLYDGTHVNPADYLIVMTQGFFPPTKELIKVAESKLLAPVRKLVKGYPLVENALELTTKLHNDMLGGWMDAAQTLSFSKSTDMLVPLGQWFERWGNTVRVGLERNNTIQTADFYDFVNYVKELHTKNPHKELVLFGVSAGGMFSELGADYLLQKHGILVDHVITAGSPEITPKTNEAFINMTKEVGVGGLIHLTAQECMRKDPRRGENKGFSELQEIMLEYGQRGKDPRIKKTAYQARYDSIVPNSFSSRVIVLPGHHATSQYTPEFLRDVSERILSTPILQEGKEHTLRAA